MAWQDSMILMLRVIISDMDETPTYSDERLEQMLVVAAQYVDLELDFDNSYTISFAPCTISPDPVGLNDDAFVNFTVLKAACLADWSTFRSKALVAGIKAKCGPAALETMQHLDGFKQLITQGPCAAYQTLKDGWIFGNAQLVKAILSPFVSNNFDPRNLSGSMIGSAGIERDRWFNWR